LYVIRGRRSRRTLQKEPVAAARLWENRRSMKRNITRRDFLNGVGVTITGPLASASPLRVFGLAESAAYPPALTGLRGSHDGSWEVAHEMREGKTWDAADTGEIYDLVVVGGGVSGLSAAYFFRKEAGPGARILVLDNHDDFGGHAKRNEFTSGKRALIGYGGSQSIDTPSGFSAESLGLLRELGVDLDRFHTAFDGKLYQKLGLGRAEFFDRETFGVDRLVRRGEMSWKEFAAEIPLPEAARKDLVRLHEDATTDYLPGLSEREKLSRLTELSYLAYLRDHVKVDPMVLTYLYRRSNGLFGIGIDGVPAIRAFRLEYPGFEGLGLPRTLAGRMGGEAKPGTKDDPYIFHFPDGNASVPRLLVRSLVPAAAPGSTMEDVVTARFDYGKLDDAASNVRLRLESTVVRVQHLGAPERATEVEVSYVRHGQAHKVRGRHVVLACWNSVIPYLCPEMPETQRKALSYAVKVPLTYTNVGIRNWTSFQKLGISSVSCPGSYFASVSLDFPVSLGSYRCPQSPEEPMVLHLTRSPASPGLSPKEQFQAGRYELLSTTFETFEKNIRDQLGRILGAGGFDPGRDIDAITVNRWPHGYAYEYAYLGEPEWTDENKPCVIGRKPFGLVTIANSDAGGEAYLDCAIDQAYRAVREAGASARGASSPSRRS
jgi:spermidine dehydrogenase